MYKTVTPFFFISLVVGSVTNFSSILQATTGLLSWSVPSYIPDNYPVITYELVYYSTNDCQSAAISYHDTHNVSLRVNVTDSNTLQYNITSLLSDTCYVFGIRAYTVNGYGPWISITDKTMNNIVTEDCAVSDSGNKMYTMIRLD